MKKFRCFMQIAYSPNNALITVSCRLRGGCERLRREAVDGREKKCADQLIQLSPSAQATAPVFDATRSKFAGPRSFERQESRMGFERRRNCELCASFPRLSNEDAPPRDRNWWAA